MTSKSILRALACVFLLGCAGVSRDCSSCSASMTGSDWVLVQYRFDGTPILCWQLHDVPVTSEDKSDGIYWKDTATGHLVHLSGWYSRVQVAGGNFASAAATLGIDVARCKGGKYE